MAVQVTLMNTYQATGQAFRAMLVSLGRQCLFYLPYLYLFNRLWGLTGLLHVQMASDLSTTLLSVLIGIQMIKGLYGRQKQEKVG